MVIKQIKLLFFSFFSFFAGINPAFSAPLEFSESNQGVFDDYGILDYMGGVDFLEGTVAESTELEEMNTAKFNYFKSKYLAIEKLISAGRFQQARDQLEVEIKESEGKDPNLYNLLGKLEIHQNNLVPAKQAYIKSLSVKKDNLLALLGLAKLTLHEKKFDQVKSYLDKIYSIDPLSYRGNLLESELQYLQNDLAGAEQFLDKAFQNSHALPEAQFGVLRILGKFFNSLQQKHFVLPYAESFYSKYPDNIAAISFYATNLLANNKLEDAEPLLRKIIQLNNQDITHRVLLARLLSKDDKKQHEVIQLFESAYSLQPENVNVLLYKASYLSNIGQFQEALREAQRLVKKRPESDIGYQLKGDIYKAFKNYVDAIKMYEIAMQKNTKSSAVYSLSNILVMQQKFDKAISLLRLQLGKVNNETIVLFKLAKVYENKGDVEKAIDLYKSVLKLSDQHIASMNNLASIYTAQQNEEALKLAEKAYNLSNKSPAIIDTYANALLHFGDKQRAVKLLEAITRQKPAFFEASLHLAEAYSATRQTEKSVALIKQLLSRESNPEVKQRAIQLLEEIQQ